MYLIKIPVKYRERITRLWDISAAEEQGEYMVIFGVDPLCEVYMRRKEGKLGIFCTGCPWEVYSTGLMCGCIEYIHGVCNNIGFETAKNGIRWKKKDHEKVGRQIERIKKDAVRRIIWTKEDV